VNTASGEIPVYLFKSELTDEQKNSILANPSPFKKKAISQGILVYTKTLNGQLIPFNNNSPSFQSINEAAKALDMNEQTISYCVIGRASPSCRFDFKSTRRSNFLKPSYVGFKKLQTPISLAFLAKQKNVFPSGHLRCTGSGKRDLFRPFRFYRSDHRR
jgi:hypothetical protein